MENPRVSSRKEILKIRAEINAKETMYKSEVCMYTLKTHEKLPNTTHYQRNANQNHNEVPFHTSQNGCYPSLQTINSGEGAEKKGSLLHC